MNKKLLLFPAGMENLALSLYLVVHYSFDELVTPIAFYDSPEKYSVRQRKLKKNCLSRHEAVQTAWAMATMITQHHLNGACDVGWAAKTQQRVYRSAVTYAELKSLLRTEKLSSYKRKVIFLS